MDNRTTLEIKSTDQGGKTTTTNLQYVNGSLSNATLVEMAQKFNALTVDTLAKVTKVTREVVY